MTHSPHVPAVNYVSVHAGSCPITAGTAKWLQRQNYYSFLSHCCLYAVPLKSPSALICQTASVISSPLQCYRQTRESRSVVTPEFKKYFSLKHMLWFIQEGLLRAYDIQIRLDNLSKDFQLQKENKIHL